jgi:AcrR family transcriptional regulator
MARGEALKTRKPQRRPGRERVAALQAAAAAILLEKGYDAATMTEVAQRAGASIGSLYLFFPTKAALANAMLTELGEALSLKLDALREEVRGRSAVAIADALFEELATFLAASPVYSVLIDLRGDHDWRQAVRLRRRIQIAALFREAVPPLPEGQPERLALVVPELMRIIMLLRGRADMKAAMTEVRAMLRHHLEWKEQG